MLSKKRIMQNLESKARNKRGLGTTLLMMGLLIGFGMPMLGAGWDINSMRLYKVDMQNVVDMGLLSLRAHTNNTYNGGKDIPNQVKTTIACNINTKNLGPFVPHILLMRRKQGQSTEIQMAQDIRRILIRKMEQFQSLSIDQI